MQFLSRLTTLVFLAGATSTLRAQPLYTDRPRDQNVRLAWQIDADGGVDGDEWAGFELAYAAKVYPLDQMILSYGQKNPDGVESHSVMLSIEELYPLSESVVPYGVAGLGYMWSDFDGTAGNENGWYGKVGGGLLINLCEAAGVYGEISYQGGADLWLDDDGTVSHNWVALLGVRFKY